MGGVDRLNRVLTPPRPSGPVPSTGRWDGHLPDGHLAH